MGPSPGDPRSPLLSVGMGRGCAAGPGWLPGGAHCPARSCPQLTDLQADSEESQRALQQLKKKCQRLAAELQDTKLHLEGQQGRNHDLEKKQRRWDCVLLGGWDGILDAGAEMASSPGSESLAKWHYHFSRDLGTSPAPTWLRCPQGHGAVPRHCRDGGDPDGLFGGISLCEVVPHGGGCSCPVALLGTRSHPVPSPSPEVC